MAAAWEAAGSGQAAQGQGPRRTRGRAARRGRTAACLRCLDVEHLVVEHEQRLGLHVEARAVVLEDGVSEVRPRRDLDHDRRAAPVQGRRTDVEPDAGGRRPLRDELADGGNGGLCEGQQLKSLQSLCPPAPTAFPLTGMRKRVMLALGALRARVGGLVVIPAASAQSGVEPIDCTGPGARGRAGHAGLAPARGGERLVRDPAQPRHAVEPALPTRPGEPAAAARGDGDGPDARADPACRPALPLRRVHVHERRGQGVPGDALPARATASCSDMPAGLARFKPPYPGRRDHARRRREPGDVPVGGRGPRRVGLHGADGEHRPHRRHPLPGDQGRARLARLAPATRTARAQRSAASGSPATRRAAWPSRGSARRTGASTRSSPGTARSPADAGRTSRSARRRSS